MKKIELQKIFLNLQSQMISRLSSNREIISHPVSKGDASELNWIDMLNTYLPKRYRVDKAFVLDSNGNLSDQIDLVIYDNQYSPFLFYQDEAKYIPSESVYAVFEVRQTLNKENINYASKKIKSVRLLKRTSAPIIHAGGQYEPKKHFSIIGGILTLDCDWIPPLQKVLSENLKELDKDEYLDLGCSLKYCGFSFDFKRKKIEISNNNSLIFFFLNLLGKLQQLGSAPALNIWEYGKFIKQ